MADPSGGKALAQLICVEHPGDLRPFVSLEDLERLAADDSHWLMVSLEAARTVFESIKERPGVVYKIERRQ